MRRVTTTLVAVSAALLVSLHFAGTAHAEAYQRPGVTERVSVTSQGVEADDHSRVPALSADGRFVAFVSAATNLVPGDTNESDDVFVHDRQTGLTERVSVSSAGNEANSNSFWPAISGDGRFVAFVSSATNLVPADNAFMRDVFVHDRQTGTTERVSVTSEDVEADGDSRAAPQALSTDGRFVVFTSDATNLVPGDTNESPDVFVRDRQAGTTKRVSVASDGTESIFFSDAAAISADGRIVVFAGQYDLASTTSDPASLGWRLFVHDRDVGTTEPLLSSGSSPDPARMLSVGSSDVPMISDDGRYVAFESRVDALVPADTNKAMDVFVHDRETGITERVSVDSGGSQAENDDWSPDSSDPAISADGRYVAFWSRATNLVPGDTNGPGGPGGSGWDLFVHDRRTGATERVSVASDGAEMRTFLVQPNPVGISADGRLIAFQSRANNLVPGDTNNRNDVFVRDRGPAVGVAKGLTAVPDGDALSVSGWAALSGQVVATASDESGDGHPAAGAELTSATVTYRPEQDDVLVRVAVSELRATPTHPLANVPNLRDHGLDSVPVVYGLSFTSGGTGYEVRLVKRQGPTSDRPTETFNMLYRCDAECTGVAALATPVASLSGGVGTTGHEVRVSVPLDAAGAEAGSLLTGFEVWAAAGAFSPAGPVSTEAVMPLDSVAVPDVGIPVTRVELGVAPATVGEDEVDYSVVATPATGFFSADLDAPAQAGSYRVWARACVADECGTSFVEVDL